MKKTYIQIWVVSFALLSLLGCAGQEMDLGQIGDMFQTEKPVNIVPVEFESLQPSITQAFMAAETAKRGELELLPFVTVDNLSKITVDELPDAATFGLQSFLITSYSKAAIGSESLGFFSVSEDIYGRKDMRVGKIDYKAQAPNGGQIQALKAWLLKQNESTVAKTDDDTRSDLINFQKEYGLDPDGQFGSKSAETLAQNMSMIYVETLENFIFYPKIPNHMVFILPYDVFKKDEIELSQGFQSLLAVGKLGLTSDKFKNVAKRGEKYILLVYFFDRINPTFAINVGFSTAKKQWDSSSSSLQKYFAKAGSWPVIVEEFTITDKLSDQLFVNIFLKEDRFKFKCVGSHKLL